MVISEEELRKRLKQGAVFYFVHPKYPANQPHFIILLNHTFDDEYPLYFLEATSDVEKIRRLGKAHSRDTFVEVSPGECELFDRQTIFDCNDIERLEFIQVMDALNRIGKFRDIDPIPGEILERILNGVQQSRRHSEHVKRAIVQIGWRRGTYPLGQYYRLAGDAVAGGCRRARSRNSLSTLLARTAAGSSRR